MFELLNSQARVVAGLNSSEPVKKPKKLPPPKPKPEPPVVLPAATGPRVSVPTSFFLAPLFASIKLVIRPATAQTRRKEIEVSHPLPRECFEEVMAPLEDGDTKEAVTRDTSTGYLKPTKVTSSLRHYEFSIRKGKVADKLLNLGALDHAPPAPPPVRPGLEKAQVGDDGVYEVEHIVAKKVIKKRTKYLVKWVGYPETVNSWEYPINIDPALVRAFEGKPPLRVRRPAPTQYKRGHGSARALLSKAAQKRGGVPTTISQVCGNIKVHYTEPTDPEKVPTLKLFFYVLTMDKDGFITWPDDFDSDMQAKLRKQVRLNLRKMIDDPLSPVDETMLPALTGTGSCVRKPPPKRQMVVAPATQGQ